MRWSKLIPEDLADTPASAKLVFAVLAESEDALSLEDLQQRTRLPRSTTHDALAELEAADAVDTHGSWHDGRQTFYTIPYEPTSGP